MGGDDFQTGGVEELTRREHLAKACPGLLEDALDGLEGRDGKERHLNRRWRWGAEDADACHHPESPLGPYEQLLHVVAGVVLAQSLQGVKDSAVRKHHLQAKDTAVQGAIPKQSQATCICGDVASNLAAALGAEVKGDHTAVLPGVFIEVLEDAPRLADQHPACWVDGDDAVEVAGAEDDLVVDGNRAAHEASISPLRHNSEPAVVAVRENGGHLLRGGRLHHHP
mmetsp:Transcript_5787/g.16258  ORF Transcript_5787/g.16258 Transcript_5787/m.16258 type:complete len:225 (+) Transcript_5787:1115-1789(+)